MKINKNHYLYLGLFLICLFIIPNVSLANTVRIDKNTIKKGYTISNLDQTMKVGIFPDSVNQPIDITFKIKNEILSQAKLPNDMRLVSDLYEFDIKSENRLDFIKPLILQLNYDSQKPNIKHVFFWDARREIWIEMECNDLPKDNIVRSAIHLPYAIIGVFEEINSVTRINLDKETISKGYTISNINSDISLGITPESVNSSVTVVLKSVVRNEGLPEQKLISNLYSFNLLSENLIKLDRPLYVSMKYSQNNNGRKVIKYWDSIKNNWIDLPTKINSAENTVKAEISLSYAILGVFEYNKDVKEGIASFYRTKNHDGCAYLDYPFGTMLKVTNLENDKSTIVQIEDRGPFIKGRIIDLSVESFSELAPLSAGIINVRVEKIEK